MMRTACYIPAIILAALLACAAPAVCQDTDGEETFVVIKAGRVLTLAGEEYVGGQIVLVDGKVRLVGKDLEYPKTARVIDARREVVMPGMILARSRWELPSYSRSGIHADRGAAKEIYLDSIDFEPLVEAGFTAVCFYPDGTGIPGPAAVYRTAGKEATRDLGPAYLRITMSSPGRDKKVLRDAVEKARKEIEKVEKARKDWEEKQKKAQEEAAKKRAAESGEKPDSEKKDGADGNKDETKDPSKEEENKEDAKTEEKKPEVFTPPKIDPAVKPLVDWIRDKKGPPLLFELYRASDLRHLDQVLKQTPELPNALFYLYQMSSSGYHHVVADLGKRKSTVLLSPQIGQLPYTVTPYNLPGELAVAGCTVALLPSGDSTSGYHDVRTRLAELVRAGLPRDEALKAVTLHAAQVLGVQQRLGTIEKGKDADLIFLDGDPLAVGTRVTRVMTLGELVWEASQRP